MERLITEGCWKPSFAVRVIQTSDKLYWGKLMREIGWD
jgi:hypothetical protein